MTEIYDTPWKQQLRDLIQKAREEGKWLWCSYQDLWFSPDRLEELHREGRFMWSANNWKLRDPRERLLEAEQRVQAAIAERDRIIDSFS